MKLQILDEGLDSNREWENYFIFNKLDIETRTMATLTKPARVLGLTSCLGDLDIINTPSMINSNWLFSNVFDSGWRFGSLLNFLLLILPFLLLLIHRVTSFKTFTRQRR